MKCPLRSALLLIAISATLIAQERASFKLDSLWHPTTEMPKASDLTELQNVAFRVIKKRQPEIDGFNWLHGVALAWHDNLLFASFGINKGKENTASEEARSQTSTDGGQTWSSLTMIDDGEEADLAVSHGVFLSHAGTLWAFHGAFYRRLEKVHTRAYTYDSAAKRWQKKGVVAESGFWPMQEPHKMENGDWIMAGLKVVGGVGGLNDPAAVVISKGDDFTTWEVIEIPRQEGLGLWGESTIDVEGSHITCISRKHEPKALVAHSNDYGRTWSPMKPSNLLMAASKPYAGRLSNGQRYLVNTTTANSGNRRSPLTIAVSQPGEASYSKVFCIRNAVFPQGQGESHPKAALSYPYAIERAGRLYIAYSNDGGRGANRNSAELAIIPLDQLNTP